MDFQSLLPTTTVLIKKGRHSVYWKILIHLLYSVELEKLLAGSMPIEPMACQFAVQQQFKANIVTQEINCCWLDTCIDFYLKHCNLLIPNNAHSCDGVTYGCVICLPWNHRKDLARGIYKCTTWPRAHHNICIGSCSSFLWHGEGHWSREWKRNSKWAMALPCMFTRRIATWKTSSRARWKRRTEATKRTHFLWWTLEDWLPCTAT